VSIRVMVDMSVTLLHHGHIRLLRKAAKYGEVVVGLSTDKDIEKYKGHTPLLTWEFRKEILESIRYVSAVVEVPYIITEAVLDEHGVQFLIHGDDNFNTISEDRLIILPRTPAISSSMLLAYNRRIKIKQQATDSDCVDRRLYERQTANNPDSRTTRRIGN
jgi:glycerol-3-phosphate cytidylyltransferase